MELIAAFKRNLGVLRFFPLLQGVDGLEKERMVKKGEESFMVVEFYKVKRVLIFFFIVTFSEEKLKLFLTEKARQT